MVKRQKGNKILWIILTVFSILLLLVVGFVRITNFKGEIIDIQFLIYSILAVLFFLLFKYLDILLKNNYYNEEVNSTRLIAGEYLLITLMYPKRYFKKNKLCKGYFIYLLSRIVLFVFIYIMIKLILEFV